MPTLVYFCTKCERQLEFDGKEEELPQLSVRCPVCGGTEVEKLDMRRSSNKNPTGTYRFSKAMGKVVMVSDRVPGLDGAKELLPKERVVPAARVGLARSVNLPAGSPQSSEQFHCTLP